MTVPRVQRSLNFLLLALVFFATSVNCVNALNLSTNTIQLTSVTLNGSDQITYGSTAAWRVDASDTTVGWNVTLSADDFSDGSGHIISVDGFDVRLLDENIVIVSGSSGPVSTQTEYASLGGTPVKIVSSAVGQGSGVYDITPQFRLSVPAAAYAGSYTSTVTITVTTGP